MALIPDKYVIHAEIPRELYEDKPALDTYLGHVWVYEVQKAGGQPIDPEPQVDDGLKYREGEPILPFMDETGWDVIQLRVHGRAYRDSSRA